MPIGDEKRVGVILVTYGSADDLPGFLASLPAAVEPLALDVMTVDNASTDASAEIAREFGARVVVNPVNVGLSRALNQGARELDTPWLLVVNPDTVLAPGAISRLVETAMTDERIGLVGPLVATLDGVPYPTGRRFPSIGLGIAHALLGPVWKNNPATRAYHSTTPTDVADVDWVSGCCMLFRREAFEAIGGYDERYFLYFEETKVALDLHRAGWRVVLDPRAEIRHREGGSMRHAPLRKVTSHHRSALRFYVDFNRGRPWIVLTPLVAAGLAVRGALSVARTALAKRLGRLDT